MGIFDKLRRKNSELAIKEMISKDYKPKYFNECKDIWKNYVPKDGQADNLQGELLREIEKIRYEAQDNGNINWDDDYSYFCDFISKSLFSPKKMAYVEDNLYDIICDKIGQLHKVYGKPIPYEKNENIKR